MTKLIIIVVAALAFADVAEAKRKLFGPDTYETAELLLCHQRQQQQGRTYEQVVAYCNQYMEEKRQKDKEKAREEVDRFNRNVRESDQQLDTAGPERLAEGL